MENLDLSMTDIKPLGGAGFASQKYTYNPPISLPESRYSGIRLTHQKQKIKKEDRQFLTQHYNLPADVIAHPFLPSTGVTKSSVYILSSPMNFSVSAVSTPINYSPLTNSTSSSSPVQAGVPPKKQKQ